MIDISGESCISPHFKLEPKSQYHQISYQKVLYMFNNIFFLKIVAN